MNHTTQELTRLTFPGGRADLAAWGIATAKANHIDLSPFYGVIVIFNSETDSGSDGGRNVVLGYKTSPPEWCPTSNFHEMGHLLGLDHSWSANPDVEYGDQWDIMSALRVWTFTNEYGANGPGLNAPYLEALGCLLPARIWSYTLPDSGAVITLAALNHPEAEGFLMAKIANGSST